MTLGTVLFCVTPTNSSPSTLTGKVNQLEVILRQLQHDLRKVSPRHPFVDYVFVTLVRSFRTLANDTCRCPTAQMNRH